MILKEKRTEKRLTQKDVADAVGITATAIYFYESGRRLPRPKTAKKIAAVLGFDWTEFYKEEDE